MRIKKIITVLQSASDPDRRQDTTSYDKSEQLKEHTVAEAARKFRNLWYEAGWESNLSAWRRAESKDYKKSSWWREKDNLPQRSQRRDPHVGT